MTDFNKLADALESYTGDGHGYQIDDAVLREAARILRAAGAADVGGLMRQAQVFADAYTEWANYPTNRLEAQHDAARAALESALRVAMAPKAGFVMVPVEPTWEMTKAAIPLLQKQDLRVADISVVYRAMIAAAQPGAQEQAK